MTANDFNVFVHIVYYSFDNLYVLFYNLMLYSSFYDIYNVCFI